MLKSTNRPQVTSASTLVRPPCTSCTRCTVTSRPDRSVSRQHMHVFEYDYATLMETLTPAFGRVMVFCQNDEYIYAGHPSTAWNYVAVCFK